MSRTAIFPGEGVWLIYIMTLQHWYFLSILLYSLTVLGPDIRELDAEILAEVLWVTKKVKLDQNWFLPTLAFYDSTYFCSQNILVVMPGSVLCC